MVQTTVRPVLTVLRTVRITMAAALASRPLVGSSCAAAGKGQDRTDYSIRYAGRSRKSHNAKRSGSYSSHQLQSLP